MVGIGSITSNELADRIRGFKQVYVRHWDEWLGAAQDNRMTLLRKNLGRWKVARGPCGNHLVCVRELGRLVGKAQQYLNIVDEFDVSKPDSFTLEFAGALDGLWEIFQNIAINKTNTGVASIVGISKAVLFLTKGRVGPAFDSIVCKKMKMKGFIVDSKRWVIALKLVCEDICDFENKNRTTFRESVPEEYQHYRVGRLYDMALGPSG